VCGFIGGVVSDAVVRAVEKDAVQIAEQRQGFSEALSFFSPSKFALAKNIVSLNIYSPWRRK